MAWYVIPKGGNSTIRKGAVWTGLKHWPILVTGEGQEVTRLGLTINLTRVTDIEALVCESRVTKGSGVVVVVRNATAVIQNRHAYKCKYFALLYSRSWNKCTSLMREDWC